VLRVQHTGGDVTAVTCAAVIDCSGRAATVARAHGARRRNHDRLVAVAALLRAGRPGDVDSATMVEAVADGWWYTALLPHGGRIVVFLTDGDLLTSRTGRDRDHWCARLGQTQHVGELRDRFGYQLAVGPVAFPAGSSRLHPVLGVRWLAAGDAAVTFDPLSSQGIVTALATGRAAATAALGVLEGRAEAMPLYRSTVEQVYTRYLQRHDDYYAREQRWPDSPFWRRRQHRGAVVAD
jgi:flavin-dependent dehydrogenase